MMPPQPRWMRTRLRGTARPRWHRIVGTEAVGFDHWTRHEMCAVTACGLTSGPLHTARRLLTTIACGHWELSFAQRDPDGVGVCHNCRVAQKEAA